MTYGVDQCRICGVTIQSSDSQAMDRYRASLNGKPTMSEKEWRAAGFKAMPTRMQVLKPLNGLCFSCKLPMGLKKVPLFKMYVPLACIIVVLLIVVFFLGSAFT